MSAIIFECVNCLINNEIPYGNNLFTMIFGIEFDFNRQFIISILAISEMFSYSKSRVLVKLNPPSKHETVVSTERSGDFKLWLGDEK